MLSPYIQNTALLVVDVAGTYNYHKALKGNDTKVINMAVQ
jgi:hypothetical protein